MSRRHDRGSAPGAGGPPAKRTELERFHSFTVPIDVRRVLTFARSPKTLPESLLETSVGDSEPVAGGGSSKGDRTARLAIPGEKSTGSGVLLVLLGALIGGAVGCFVLFGGWNDGVGRRATASREPPRAIPGGADVPAVAAPALSDADALGSTVSEGTGRAAGSTGGVSATASIRGVLPAASTRAARIVRATAGVGRRAAGRVGIERDPVRAAGGIEARGAPMPSGLSLPSRPFEAPAVDTKTPFAQELGRR